MGLKDQVLMVVVAVMMMMIMIRMNRFVSEAVLADRGGRKSKMKDPFDIRTSSIIFKLRKELKRSGRVAPS